MIYENLPEIVKKWKAPNWDKYFNDGQYKFSMAEREDIDNYYSEYILGTDKENEPVANTDIKEKEKDFIMVPDVLLTFHKEKKLNWFDILLYSKLKGLCNKRGYCWALNRSLSELFNVSVRNVQYALEKLEKNKLIKIKMNYRENTFHVESRHITIIPIKKIKNGQDIPKIPEDKLGMDSIDGIM